MIDDTLHNAISKLEMTEEQLVRFVSRLRDKQRELGQEPKALAYSPCGNRWNIVELDEHEPDYVWLCLEDRGGFMAAAF